jgi:hypothetical protein
MDTALLAFDVDGLHQGRLLRPFDALAWMEALELTLAHLMTKHGAESSCFTSNISDDISGPIPHSTFFFPISHDARRARLDQVLIHAPRCFDEGARIALDKLRQIEGPFGAASVVLIDLGHKADFTEKVEHFRRSKVWRSITPVVSFQPAKDEDEEGNVFADHLRADLRMQGFPPCSRIDVAVDRGRFIAIDEFEASRTRGIGSLIAPESNRMTISSVNRQENTATSPVFGLRLEFDETVQGPLALGRWARYGMGQFLPG